MWSCLRDPRFSCFNSIPARETHAHDDDDNDDTALAWVTWWAVSDWSFSRHGIWCNQIFCSCQRNAIVDHYCIWYLVRCIARVDKQILLSASLWGLQSMLNLCYATGIVGLVFFSSRETILFGNGKEQAKTEILRGLSSSIFVHLRSLWELMSQTFEHKTKIQYNTESV